MAEDPWNWPEDNRWGWMKGEPPRGAGGPDLEEASPRGPMASDPTGEGVGVDFGRLIQDRLNAQRRRDLVVLGVVPVGPRSVPRPIDEWDTW